MHRRHTDPCKSKVLIFVFGVAILILVTTLLSMPASSDTIYNESGVHEGNKLQRAVFIPIFLPEEMDCTQPVRFITPKAEKAEPKETLPYCDEPHLVLGAGDTSGCIER